MKTIHETKIPFPFYRKNCMVRRMQLCELCTQVIHEYPPSQKPASDSIIMIGIFMIFHPKSKNWPEKFIFILVHIAHQWNTI